MMGSFGWMGTPSGQGPVGSWYGGYGMMDGWYGGAPPSQAQAISIDQAVTKVQTYLTSAGSSDLALDEVMEFQYNFYALVKEKSTGRGAFELIVDKHTGAVFPEMGPNMMWNTKYGMGASGYGMMGGWWGVQPGVQPGPMTVTADQARSIAQQWLDQSQPGSTVETPDEFYGYYTVHTLKDGKITGMLSVNGYTGQVWYHTWHGAFVQVK